MLLGLLLLVRESNSERRKRNRFVLLANCELSSACSKWEPRGSILCEATRASRICCAASAFQVSPHTRGIISFRHDLSGLTVASEKLTWSRFQHRPLYSIFRSGKSEVRMPSRLVIRCFSWVQKRDDGLLRNTLFQYAFR
jgi:hypothetical protein